MLKVIVSQVPVRAGQRCVRGGRLVHSLPEALFLRERQGTRHGIDFCRLAAATFLHHVSGGRCLSLSGSPGVPERLHVPHDLASSLDIKVATLLHQIAVTAVLPERSSKRSRHQLGHGGRLKLASHASNAVGHLAS